MKVFLLLALLIPQGQTTLGPQTESPVTVLTFKYYKDRQHVAYDPGATLPAAAMIGANKNFEKNRRANTSPGERDPNLDTLDGRSAAMERAVQQSRAPKPIEGYAFRAKVKNATPKSIEVIFWEYQFKEPSGNVLSKKQFLCGVAIKGEKDKELQAFSISGPEVVSVESLANKPGDPGGQVVINRVEYADGSIWQRQDWKFVEIRSSYQRAISTPWSGEMCRGL